MKKIFIFILSLTLGIAQGIPADITLVSVNVEGNAVTSENTILFTAGLREGQTISQAEFPRAIKRLWQLGLFQDIQLRYDDETDEGLSLTILVKENFILGDLSYDGNKKIKDRKFEDEVSLSKGQRLRPNTLHETAKKIKELYEEKGYLNAEINPVLEIPVEESTLFDGRAKDLVRNVVFNIQENDKIKTGKIIFEGNESYSDLRLRWTMKETKQQRWYMFWRSTFDDKKFDEDLNLVSTYYRNKGYRDFRIVSDTILFSENKKMLNLVVTIDEGPQYKYRHFSWEGMTLFDEEMLQRSLGLESGDQYSDEDFNLADFDRVQGL